MILRRMQTFDLMQIQYIHQKYYNDEFPLADFQDTHFLPQYVVIDDNDRIITAGGVRTILESIFVTNQDFSPRDRREALLMLLEALIHEARAEKYNQIHAFIIEDDTWEKQLEKYGFSRCRGNALCLPIG